MIAIIDYGIGNIGSIANMLEEIDVENEITCDKKTIQQADKLILPGVGSYDRGMSLLESSGVSELIKKEAANGKPMLGICLGMQLLGRNSEEGKRKGLGLIPFDNIKFKFRKESKLKIPHMGWDVVRYVHESPLTDGLSPNDRYYFVHSYYAKCDKDENVLITCDYGFEFAAAVFKDNVYGVQFHPEKSHFFGMRLLENFVKRC